MTLSLSSRHVATMMAITLSAPVYAALPPTVALPQLDNKAYALLDYSTGQVLASANPDAELPPASLTKMMTSYIIGQDLSSGRFKEQDIVRMNATALCQSQLGESCMRIPLNGSAPLLDMLRGIVIQSGNDSARAAAEYVGGSQQAFTERMNVEAKKLGMHHTQFMNVSGMPMSGHYASAHDLTTLARAIIHEQPQYFPIYGQRQYRYSPAILLESHNPLLVDPTVDGMKTGHTNEAGYCLVVTQKIGSMRLISAVLGTKTRAESGIQSKALLAWGFNQFETLNLSAKNQVLKTAPLWLGQNNTLDIGTSESFTITIPRSQRQNVRIQTTLITPLKAPITQNQQVGTMTAILDGHVLGTVPLIALNHVQEGNVFKRLIDYVKLLLI